MEFKIGGTRYRISFGFLAVVAVYMMVDRTGAGLPVICAIGVHECGHILVMRLVGARIAAMEFCAFGVRLEKRGFLSDRQECAVYLGGVAANAIGIVIGLVMGRWEVFIVVSGALMGFNLLPVGRLDGGKLLEIGLRRWGKGERMRLGIGFMVLAPLFGAGFWLGARGNYSMLITAGYLAASLLKG